MTCLLLLLDYGLGGSDGGLLAVGTLNQWSYAVPTVRPAGSPSHPVWSTRPSGNTFNDSIELLTLQLPALTGDRPVLVLEHATLLGPGDTARFELDTGSGFEVVEPIHGYPSGDAFRGDSGGYITSGIDLTGVPAASRLRLHFAADASGSGPGWFLRSAKLWDGDPIPPAVTLLDAPEDTDDLLGPYRVEVAIEEDVEVVRADLYWTVGGIEESVALVPNGARWTGAIPAVLPDTTVSWRVEVADCATQVDLPGSSFRVALPAPSDLSGPSEPHTVARVVTLDWEPPDTTRTIESYALTDLESGLVTQHVGTTGQVALVPDLPQRFEVRARYDAGLGDPSDVLELDVEVPVLRDLSPRQVFPGDRVYVSLEGRSLYLLQGVSSVGFGGLGEEDPRVDQLTVLDVDRARALVHVPADAGAGQLDVIVTGTHGSFVFRDALEVLDVTDAPRITLVEPSSLEQAETVRLKIFANRGFAEPVSIIVDDDLVLGGPPWVQGDRLEVDLAALGASRPGMHRVVVDDGTRAYEVEIEVTERLFTGQKTCASAPPPGPQSLFLLTLIIMRIRTRGPWRSLP